MVSKVDFLVVLCASLFGLVLALNIIPYIIVTDEVGYSLMAHSLAIDGNLEIWNGWDEVQSYELIMPSTDFVTNGVEFRLYGVPAPLYPFIAYPFYTLWGLSGLFVLNIVSYSLLIAFIYHLAKLFLDEKCSAAAALLYSLFTTSLSFTEYVLPQLLSAALVVIPVYIVFKTVNDGGESIYPLFLAGLIGGLSIGVRFTNGIFVFIMALLVFMQSTRRGLYAFATGLFIPLSLIAWINFQLYSDVFETSYGNPLDFIKFKYLILALPLLVGYWLLASKRISLKTGVLASAVICMFLALWMWDAFAMFVSSFYARVFDMTVEPSVTKVIYKKALLQSTPLLIISVLSALFVPKDNRRKLFLSLLGMAFLNIVFYSTLTQHGGSDETFSMRYFMESVPFLAILSVHSAKMVFNRFDRAESVLFLLVFAAVAFAYLRDGNVLYSLERAMRVLPAILSMLLLATCIIYLKTGRQRSLSIALLSVCLAVSFSYSYADWKLMREYSIAVNNLEYQLRDIVANDSAVFVEKRAYAGLLVPAKMAKRVRILTSSMDDWVDTPALVDYYVESGIPVYYLNLNNLNEEWMHYFGNISLKYDRGRVTSIDSLAVEV